MTLNELKDAINSDTNNFGVTANIVNTGDPIQGTKLVFTSKITGDANNLVITNDNDELDSVSTVATGVGTAGITIAAADMAKNAVIKVDGLEISNDTNTFTDSVQDLTIRALKEGASGEVARLTVDNDRDSVSKLIDELIANYNNFIGTVGLQTRVGRPLNGDPSIRAMSNQIFNTLSNKINGAGPFETVFDLGIGIKKDGYLERSSLVRSLNDAMDTNYDSIDNVFAGENGIATQLNKVIDNYIGSSGLLKKRTENINQNIKDAGEDKLNLDVRMQDLEASLRKKYAGLDVLLAQMRQTQSALGAQLASLPGFTRNSS
jgi:flagellar hook-associated protein 2